MKKRTIIILLICIIALAAGASASTMAKYISSTSAKTAVTSAKMYFDSDSLTSDGAAYTVNDTKVGIRVTNYEDSLKVSNVNVTYSITVTNGTATVGATTAASFTGLTLTGGSQQLELFTVQPNVGQTEVTVTAAASAPYASSLSATYTFTNNAVLTLTKTADTDESTVILALTTNDYEGNVTLTWTANLIPDTVDGNGLLTGTLVSGTYTKTVAVEAHRTYTLYFYMTASYSTTDYNTLTAVIQG